MLKNFIPSPRPKKNQQGFTFVELMVASLTSVMIVGTLMLTMVYVSKSFKAVQNYTDLDRSSRLAVDTLSRDIRNASQVLTFTTNSIVMTNIDGSRFSYRWNPSDTTFKRYYTNANGTHSTTVLLTNCDTFSFYFYQRYPTPTNYPPFYTTTNAATVKLINIDWKCSRTIMGSKLNTESVQTAQIGLRN